MFDVVLELGAFGFEVELCERCVERCVELLHVALEVRCDGEGCGRAHDACALGDGCWGVIEVVEAEV